MYSTTFHKYASYKYKFRQITKQKIRLIPPYPSLIAYIQHLSPTSFITIPDSQLGADGQPAGPDSLEPSLLHYLGRKAIVGFHYEVSLFVGQHVAQLRGFRGGEGMGH